MAIPKVTWNYKSIVFDAFCRETRLCSSASKAWEEAFYIKEVEIDFLKIS
jgi:hypothetical protein